MHLPVHFLHLTPSSALAYHKLLQCSVSEVIEFVDDKQMEATYQKSQPQELVYAPFFDETDGEVTRKDRHEMGL